MQKLDLDYRWMTVMHGAEPFRLGERMTSHARLLYRTPAIYCWRIEWPGKPDIVYIGETEDLGRRVRCLQNCRPANKTAWSLKRILMQSQKSGADVRLQFLLFPPFSLNDVQITQASLANPHVRRMMENLAIVSEMHLTAQVLNAGQDLAQKKMMQLRRTFRKAGPAEQRRILDLMVRRIENAHTAP